MPVRQFALIVGAMKSGTTSLFHYLSQHHSINPSRTKETNFFSHEENWRRGAEWYYGHWEWHTGEMALEGSVCYTKVPFFPNCAERIRTLNDDFKFVYLVRHPFERIESHYSHAAIRTWGTDLLPITMELDPRLIDVTRYASQIGAYRRIFGASKIYVASFDRLCKEPEYLLRDILEFLGLDSSFRFNSLDVVFNPTVGKRVDEGSPLFGQKTIIREKFRLSDAQKEIILRELEDDLTQLRDDYGFDLAHWNLNL